MRVPISAGMLGTRQRRALGSAPRHAMAFYYTASSWLSGPWPLSGPWSIFANAVHKTEPRIAIGLDGLAGAKAILYSPRLVFGCAA